ncbi:MAG: NAD(+) synthase, partial [Alistipes sp.]|nr:NAD(+) synthase [Alistipes sp.]
MKRYGFFKVAGAIPMVGVADCRGNSSRIEALIRQADRQGVELVAFPELSLTGATCGDLFLQPTLQQAAREALTELVRRTADCHVASLVGLPLRVGGRLYNCA